MRRWVNQIILFLIISRFPDVQLIWHHICINDWLVYRKYIPHSAAMVLKMTTFLQNVYISQILEIKLRIHNDISIFSQENLQTYMYLYRNDLVSVKNPWFIKQPHSNRSLCSISMCLQNVFIHMDYLFRESISFICGHLYSPYSMANPMVDWCLW